MTVCVSVKVSDCIVFAADSASTVVQTMSDGQQIENIYRHGNKVYNLFRGLPLCAMTCGLGNIGRNSIGELSKELRLRLMGDGDDLYVNRGQYSVQEVAEKARGFLFAKYDAQPQKPESHHRLEFYVGGYGSSNESGEVWQIVIEDGAAPDPVLMAGADDDFGLNWSGQPEAISRLVLGYGSGLVDALRQGGADDAAISGVLQSIRSQPGRIIINGSMPVQDAIDLADFLVDTTKKFVRFLPGSEIVGGDTDICAVTRFEGFRWIKRKHFYDERLNRERNGHVG